MSLQILIRLLSQKRKKRIHEILFTGIQNVGIVFVIDVPAPCIVPCNECASESVFFLLSKSYLCFFFFIEAHTQIP